MNVIVGLSSKNIEDAPSRCWGPPSRPGHDLEHGRPWNQIRANHGILNKVHGVIDARPPPSFRWCVSCTPARWGKIWKTFVWKLETGGHLVIVFYKSKVDRTIQWSDVKCVFIQNEPESRIALVLTLLGRCDRCQRERQVSMRCDTAWNALFHSLKTLQNLENLYK